MLVSHIVPRTGKRGPLSAYVGQFSVSFCKPLALPLCCQGPPFQLAMDKPPKVRKPSQYGDMDVGGGLPLRTQLLHISVP
jgi:hypothetical protein